MIMGERFEFLGAHVTPAVKDTVRAVAANRKESMSKFISDSLEERLASLGVKVEEDIDNGPKLPFEEDQCSAPQS
jgi:hypothetical protein